MIKDDFVIDVGDSPQTFILNTKRGSITVNVNARCGEKDCPCESDTVGIEINKNASSSLCTIKRLDNRQLITTLLPEKSK